MDDGYELPPWGFSRDVLSFGTPLAFVHPAYRTVDGAETATEVRVYQLDGETVLLADYSTERRPEDAGRFAHDAWVAAAKPVPFRFVWHSYEGWGDAYWEDVWHTDERGWPVIQGRLDGTAGFVLERGAEPVDDLLLRLAAD